MLELADLVADGWTVAAASRHMGISQQTGSKMWCNIKEAVGERAV